MVERDGRIWAGLVLAQDITDLRATETGCGSTARAWSSFPADDLTRLANRLLFRDRLGHALARRLVRVEVLVGSRIGTGRKVTLRVAGRHYKATTRRNGIASFTLPARGRIAVVSVR
jgi:hypothetical protein